MMLMWVWLSSTVRQLRRLAPLATIGHWQATPLRAFGGRQTGPLLLLLLLLSASIHQHCHSFLSLWGHAHGPRLL